MTGLILGYLGPETILPMTSVLAAGIGILLIGWRWLVRLLLGPVRYFLGKRDARAAKVVAPAAESAAPMSSTAAAPEARG
jgi:hypothetical protein